MNVDEVSAESLQRQFEEKERRTCNECFYSLAAWAALLERVEAST